MLPFLQQFRTYLDAIQPGLFNASLAGLLFAALWLLRKFKPLFFAKLPPSLQAWPALATGAVIAALSASTDGNLGGAVLNALGMAFTGLLSGVMASGIHRTLKESALPYGTSDVPPKKSPTPLVGIVWLVALLGVCGCGSFLHVADPTIDDDISKLCSTLGTEKTAAIQAEADKQKLSFDDVKHLFDVACALRIKQGLEPAKAAGLAAARHERESDAGTP
jgi:hypothetical protein